MDDDVQQPEKKISFAVGILGLIIAGGMDVLSIIPGVGDVEEVPAGVLFFLNIISGMGGVVLTVQAIVMVLKAIPVAQALPLWTSAWAFTWYAENHPKSIAGKLEQEAAIAGKVEGALEGNVEEGGEAAEGAEAAAQAREAAAGAAEAGATAAEAGEAGAGAAEEAGELENTKPSEESTERGSEAEEKGEERRKRRIDQQQGSGNQDEDEESEEERQKEDAEERYEDMTQTDAERSPIDVAEREDFATGERAPGEVIKQNGLGLIQGGKNKTNKPVDNIHKEEDGDNRQQHAA